MQQFSASFWIIKSLLQEWFLYGLFCLLLVKLTRSLSQRRRWGQVYSSSKLLLSTESLLLMLFRNVQYAAIVYTHTWMIYSHDLEPQSHFHSILSKKHRLYRFNRLRACLLQHLSIIKVFISHYCICSYI